MSKGDGSEMDSVSLRHVPNPSSLHHHPDFPVNSFAFTWFYRTELRNNLPIPIRILWFEGFRFIDGEWVPGNITGRSLDQQDFMDWYADGDPVIDGWLQPGQTAVCDGNWHGSETFSAPRVKWAYMFAASDGTEHFVEEEIESVPYESTGVLLGRPRQKARWKSSDKKLPSARLMAFWALVAGTMIGVGSFTAVGVNLLVAIALALVGTSFAFIFSMALPALTLENETHSNQD